uniref:S-adenosylmethionine mitochondrial carrier protein n=1 Tax=Solea senegalensis TaxID=28829 RepID=UPI001CD8D9D2|nr:S-adenosylmethionine mitochondrial carrier protein [Solea senegalensis]
MMGDRKRRRRSIHHPTSVFSPPLSVSVQAGSSTASGNIPVVLHEVWKSRGLTGLFAGSIPRITFISAGGFIFLGAYEKVRRTLL